MVNLIKNVPKTFNIKQTNIYKLHYVDKGLARELSICRVPRKLIGGWGRRYRNHWRIWEQRLEVKTEPIGRQYGTQIPPKDLKFCGHFTRNQTRWRPTKRYCFANFSRHHFMCLNSKVALTALQAISASRICFQVLDLEILLVMLYSQFLYDSTKNLLAYTDCVHT